MAKKMKLKTRKSVLRRIKITGTGKLLRRQSFGRHLKASKSRSRSRKLKRAVLVSGKFERKLRNILGV
ncbi:MAG: 50S ribosomal protein L35 [Candidatus Blackburnbacteria bacterium]|nr:50S ribosomal protein L35 [Candidatus Blackburnbacteria bacterium]